MNKLLRVLFLVFSQIIISCQAFGTDGFQKYVAPISNESIYILEEKNRVEYGPYADITSFCTADDIFYCVQHPVFWFSIPKEQEEIEPGTKWEHMGKRYTVKAIEKKYQIRKYHSLVYIIDSEDIETKSISEFVYSPKYGVLFVRHQENTVYGTLILDSEIGFGFSEK